MKYLFLITLTLLFISKPKAQEKTSIIHCFVNGKLKNIKELDSKRRLIFEWNHSGQTYKVSAFKYIGGDLKEEIFLETIQPLLIIYHEKIKKDSTVLFLQTLVDNSIVIDSVSITDDFPSNSFVEGAVSIEDKKFFESIRSFKDVIKLPDYISLKKNKAMKKIKIGEYTPLKSINLLDYTDPNTFFGKEFNSKGQEIKNYTFEKGEKYSTFCKLGYTSFDSLNYFGYYSTNKDTLEYTEIEFNNKNLPIKVSFIKIQELYLNGKQHKLENETFIEYDEKNNEVKREIVDYIDGLEKRTTITNTYNSSNKILSTFATNNSLKENISYKYDSQNRQTEVVTLTNGSKSTLVLKYLEGSLK